MNNLKRALVMCLLLGPTWHFAQSSIKGKIAANDGNPVPFASVSIKNSQKATVSEYDGSYELKNVPFGKAVISVACFGFLTYQDTVEVSNSLEYNIVLLASAKQLDEVVVDASRLKNNSGMAYNDLNAEAIKKSNLGQDAPYALNALPNVVVNSDAGNGVGYTGLRIRGSDATRVNVTINGVPVNDAESQGTFWVNMPDLLSSANNIQVQRGVGTSANGAGAFGASINFQTNALNEKAYGSFVSTAGSYGTFRNTMAGGTGLVKNKYSLDVRASNIRSNGYIDRASSDLNSFYLASGYYGKKSVLKLIHFSGWESTYQAWNYVPEDSIKANNRTYNSCGEYIDDDGTLRYYGNETDNYNQHNSQLHFIHSFNSRLNLNVTAHYTKGMGYFEQFRKNDDFSAYGISKVFEGNDTIASSDLVRRLWLNNDFAGGIFNLYYKSSSSLAFTLGGGYNSYFGRHFGRVVWTDYHPKLNAQYYLNTANKNDGNLYLKTNWRVNTKANVFVDLQGRFVNYDFTGDYDFPGSPQQNASYFFFNPKFGLNYNILNNLSAYASVAMASKEPSRNDFVQSNANSRPSPEQLTDFEIGIKYNARKWNSALNVYNMDYKNQLVLNGQINNVGAYNRINVDKSYRRGIEFESSVQLSKMLELGGNVSISSNKILNFEEYLDSSDVAGTLYVQFRKQYNETDISFSPALVSSAFIKVVPAKGLELSLIHKYVGRQFLDNTSNKNRSINAYHVFDFRANYTIKTKKIPEIVFMLSVYNIGNSVYETNGYTYSYYSGPNLITRNFLAPAAPMNFLSGISVRF